MFSSSFSLVFPAPPHPRPPPPPQPPPPPHTYILPHVSGHHTLGDEVDQVGFPASEPAPLGCWRPVGPPGSALAASLRESQRATREVYRTPGDQSTRMPPSSVLEGGEAPFSQTRTMWRGHKPCCAPRHAATCSPGLLGAGGLELAPIVATGHHTGTNTTHPTHHRPTPTTPAPPGTNFIDRRAHRAGTRGYDTLKVGCTMN